VTISGTATQMRLRRFMTVSLVDLI